MQPNRIPLTLRLAGIWILWAAWCQCCGWGLSALHQLSGWGYLAATPILSGAAWWWLKTTAATQTKVVFSPAKKLGRRFRRPLPMIYLGIAALSLVAALLYPPWSFDATSYRLPRILYWWSEHRWYWIGTIDHRLDFSSCGFEWQMLPAIIFTRTDRLIFLLNWIPFLLMPGLVFFAFRALGVTGRSARRWMWLLPAGFCYALQCSGLQNDGYMVLYTLAIVALAVLTRARRQIIFLWLALLAAALLTGAKLSNLPLLLPLGLLLLPGLRTVNWFNWKTTVIVFIAVGCSFAPLAFLCWKHTGDWKGDPADQWNAHPRSPAGAFTANAIAMANDAVHPPVFPIAKKINARLKPLNESRFMQWLRWAQPNSDGLAFGDMVYEGQAGLGCGLGLYALFVLLGAWFVQPVARGAPADFPWEWRWAPWGAWLSLFTVMAEVAFSHVTRYAASIYPLLVISIVLLPRCAALERKKIAALVSGLAMLMVIPVILLTPARPVLPLEQILSRLPDQPTLKKFAAKYHHWTVMRDDLAPLRDRLPPGTTRLGYGCGFRDTSYGLWKPLGSRVVEEIGLPLHRQTPPPAGLKYAVITGNGLHERYRMDVKTWCDAMKAKVIFELPRNISLVSGEPQIDIWYLVEFQNN